jgi:hypothetical protein
VFQHSLHNAVGTFPVLCDLLQVASQSRHDLVHFVPPIRIQHGETRRGGFLQFLQQID